MVRECFIERIKFDAALGWVDAVPTSRVVEEVALPAALGRVLADPVTFTLDRPPFDLALVDGYALQAEVTLGASSYNPLSLPLAAFSGAATTPFAAKCSAGVPLPAGADAVLSANAAEETAGMLEVGEPAARGAGVARRGEFARCGTVALPAGRLLGPMQLALAASAGAAVVRVQRRPKVALDHLARRAAENTDTAHPPASPGIAHNRRSAS